MMISMQQNCAAFQGDFAKSEPGACSVSSIRPPQERVRVANPQSRWVTDLRERLNEVASLPRGWDGYDGRPVSFITALFAANLIERLFVAGVPAPSLVPGNDGTLQMEWHCNQYDIEIDVLAPYRVEAYRRNHQDGSEQELELGSDFTALSEWMYELAFGRKQELLAKA